jgi:hypothetical protein
MLATGMGSAMNWRALASSIFDYLDQVPSPKWLGIAATFVSLVLLIGLIVLSDRYLRLRRRVAVQGKGTPLKPQQWAGKTSWRPSRSKASGAP